MDNPACAFLVIVFGVVAVAVMYTNSRNYRLFQEQLNEARFKYDEILERLKLDPANPNLKQQTLELGRQYSNLTRQRKGVTIYDEIALMNDINAATAAATSPVLSSGVQESKQTAEDRLIKLADLKAKGLIDQEEYAKKRQQILDEM